MSSDDSTRMPPTAHKPVFWCLFDYGAGELLLRIAARAATDIRRKYPQLEVIDGVPPWFESAENRELDRYPRFDIDTNPAPGVLADLHALSAAPPGRRLYYVEFRDGPGSVRQRRVWARNLAELERRCPEVEALPMVLAPAAAWSTEISSVDELAARLCRAHGHGHASHD
jgi:hypothetical protein